MISVGKSQHAVHAYSPIANTHLRAQRLEALESKAAQLHALPHHHFQLSTYLSISTSGLNFTFARSITYCEGYIHICTKLLFPLYYVLLASTPLISCISTEAQVHKCTTSTSNPNCDSSIAKTFIIWYYYYYFFDPLWYYYYSQTQHLIILKQSSHYSQSFQSSNPSISPQSHKSLLLCSVSISPIKTFHPKWDITSLISRSVLNHVIHCRTCRPSW